MWGAIARPRVIALPLAVLAGMLAAGVSPAAGAHPARHARHASGHRGRGHAHAAIVGGTLATIGQAPWTAIVAGQSGPTDAWICDGAILDATHVLTAAHCAFDPGTKLPAPASDLAVAAGYSNLGSHAGAISPQEVAVAAVRVDPGYEDVAGAFAGFDPYDVAVVQLATPLTFGAGVQSISLAPSSTSYAGGTVSITGFGVEQPGPASVVEQTPADGTLNTLATGVPPAGECVPVYDALVGCATTPTGSTCNGDSGSAVTLPGSPPLLVGIVDWGTNDANGNACEPGSYTGFAKVTTPEIEDFVLAAAPPYPAAPEGGADGASCTPVAPRVGDTLSCPVGAWTGQPSLTYAYVDDVTGAVLASGSQTYTIAPSDVGRQIDFVVTATNPGGTAVARSASTDAVVPAPVVSRAVTTTTTTSSSTRASTSITTSTSVTRRTTSTATIATPAPVHAPPRLRLIASPMRVRPGAGLALRVQLSGGASAITRGLVCVAVPSHTAFATTAGAVRHGAQACWTVSVAAGATRAIGFELRVASHLKPGTLIARASEHAAGGPSLGASVSVALL